MNRFLKRMGGGGEERKRERERESERGGGGRVSKCVCVRERDVVSEGDCGKVRKRENEIYKNCIERDRLRKNRRMRAKRWRKNEVSAKKEEEA